MSATLVETHVFPLPHQLLDKQRPSYQLQTSVLCPLSQDTQYAAQLAHIASQHHTSEYNRLKFGPQGCPVPYIPISIGLPDHFRALQQRQLQCAQNQRWWPCDRIAPHSDPPIVLGPCGVSSPSTVSLHLQEEISEAIASPLKSNPGCLPLQSSAYPLLKTSSSHPINISSTIPPELIPIISSHLLLASSSSQPSQPSTSSNPRLPPPTIFEIPLSLSLDRLTYLYPRPYPVPLPSTTQWTPLSHKPQWNPDSHSQITKTHFHARSSVSEALQAAINSGLAAIKNPPVASSSSSQSLEAAVYIGADLTSQCASSSAPRSSSTETLRPRNNTISNLSSTTFSSLTLLDGSSSPTRSKTPLDSLSPHILKFPIPGSLPSLSSARCKHKVDTDPNSSMMLSVSDLSGNTFDEMCHGDNDANTITIDEKENTSQPLTPMSPFQKPLRPQTPCITQFQIGRTDILWPRDSGNITVDSDKPNFTLGNLFLSSCPGKKVRLSGPVKGRGGVCRDLDTDLQRMKDLGVRCIICCLDDEELEFLGAPWPEYRSAAHNVGMDILRIPTPEGLAPLTPAALDAHLTDLIKMYTLNGIPMLVHCRGGVGRAGVVACCWILKVGLCGWIETDTYPGPGPIRVIGPTGLGTLAGVETRPTGATVIQRGTMQLVERVIGVLRKRRSLKAVETYEQVKFLVDYVEYLGEKGADYFTI